MMAGREMLASWRRLLFFFICISIGVGAIVALRSVIQNVRQVFAGEARALIAADVVISTNRPIEPQVAATIERRLVDAGARQVAAVELATMVRPANGSATRMVELRGVEPAFPYYGAVRLQGQPYDHALLRGFGALARPELLAQLGLDVGDALLIGTHRFTIRGVVEAEPGRRLGAFSLGPRVFVDLADLRKTGLLTFGTRANYQQLVQVPAGSHDELVATLRRDLASTFVRVRSYKATEDDIGEDFTRAENYLSLVGLVIVILGGIGVSSVTRVFVQQKIKSIAILKCVGARSGQLLAVYMAQVLALGLLGSLLGVGLADVAIRAVPDTLAAAATPGVQVRYGLTLPAVAQGLGIGLLVSVLFSLVPLLDVRHVKPSLLFRDEPAARRRDLLRLVVMVLVGSGLLGLAVWQAGSLRVGLVVAAGFLVATLALHLAGVVLIKAIAPLSQSTWFPLRHAVLQLSRPGSQARIVLLAVGLGSFFIVGVRSLQETLLREFTVDLAPDAPDMFLLDIQGDQVHALAALLRAREDGDAPAAACCPSSARG
jgi:putative ABC transport system permease protein